MNLSNNNWRDRRTVFRPTHYSISNYSTETKNEMKTAFGEDLFLNNLHLIPDPLMKNLADTIITEEKMAPKSKLDNNIDLKNEDMLNQPDYSPLSGITNFFTGVMNVISNAMFSKRKQQDDFVAETGGQMAAQPMWHAAKLSDENKILHDENRFNDMSSEVLAAEMTECKKAAAHCQNKIEQVRLLLSSKPVPCNFRSRRRPKRVFVEASSVEDSFEDAFSPEDFENIANDSYIQYSSPVCYHDHIFHEIDGPKVKTETAETSEKVSDSPPICESTEIVKNVPEIVTANENKLECDTKQELVASCEDKISKLKALLQERRNKPKTIVEPEPVSVPEQKVSPKPKTATKVKDKRFKNPNRLCGKRMKSKMKKNIQDDLQFANEINSEDLSSVENSPSMCSLEKYIPKPLKSEKEYFDEVSGCFHPASVAESEDCFQIVFNDSPRLRRASDCDSEDSFIVFEDSPDSCYTSNDVFGESSDSEDYDSDSDLSDSGCGNMSFKLAASLSKSVCNLADDSLYAERSEDEVDCANTKGVTVCDNVPVGGKKTGLLIDARKKLLRKDLPAKRVQFSQQPPKVHVMRVWTFAARQARAGHWERYALDRERFKRRIADVDMAVSWVLKPQHRSLVMFQRFMPWWNAQKRKELAEKKEREAQEKRKKEEEELRAKEAEKLSTEEEKELGSQEDNIEEVGEHNTLVRTELKENGQLEGPKARQAEVNATEDDKRSSRSSKSGKEDETIQESTTVQVNTEIIKKDVKKNDCSNDLNGKNYKLEKVTQYDSKTSIDNENKIDKKTAYKNDVSKNSEIIPLNDKIFDLNNDFVAKSILDT